MQKLRTNRCYICLYVLLIISMLFRIDAFANTSNDLYVATITLDKNTAPNSTFVLQQGLLQVLSKVSGRLQGDISSISAINQALQKPENYLAKYTVQLSEINPNIETHSLQPMQRVAVLSFISRRVDNLVKISNLGLVDKKSVTVVLWLWTEGPQGRGILTEASMSQIEKGYRQLINKIAIDSGLKILYPLQDLEEQILTSGALTDTTIEIDKLIKASKRYGAEVMLVGFIPKDALFSKWALLNKNLNSSNYSLKATDATDAITQAFIWLNKNLNNERTFSQVRLSENNQSNQVNQTSLGIKENVLLRIDSIETLEKYNKINEYLKNISLIEDVRVNRIGQDWIELSVSTKQGKDALISFLNKDNKLVKQNVSDTSSMLAGNQTDQSLSYGWLNEL